MHCNKEYRIGKTCGMKLVYDSIPVPRKCKRCNAIDVELRRRMRRQAHNANTTNQRLSSTDSKTRLEDSLDELRRKIARLPAIVQFINQEIRDLAAENTVLQRDHEGLVLKTMRANLRVADSELDRKSEALVLSSDSKSKMGTR